MWCCGGLISRASLFWSSSDKDRLQDNGKTEEAGKIRRNVWSKILCQNPKQIMETVESGRVERQLQGTSTKHLSTVTTFSRNNTWFHRPFFFWIDNWGCRPLRLRWNVPATSGTFTLSSERVEERYPNVYGNSNWTKVDAKQKPRCAITWFLVQYSSVSLIFSVDNKDKFW